MLSNSALRYLPAQAPRDLSALLQSCFALWLASLRACFWPCMLYALITTLASLHLFMDMPDPATWQDPEAMRQAIEAEAPSIRDFLLVIVIGLLAWFVLIVPMRRQALMSRGQQEQPDRSIAESFRHVIPLVLASLGYALLNITAFSTVFLALWLGNGTSALVQLSLLLVGLLLCAAPLAWISVAALFYGVPVLLDGHGPISALRESFRLVRGQWLTAAVVLSVGILAWLGIYSTITTFPMLLTGGIAYAMHGLAGLLKSDWMIWSQVLSIPFLAASTPLLTAVYVECHQELRLRRAAADAAKING